MSSQPDMYNVLVCASTEDGDMKMKWSCGHEGYLNLDWLKKHCYSSHSLETARKNSLPAPVTKVHVYAYM